MELTTRNATLEDLARLLQDQHARKLDVVAPASAIRTRDGILQLQGTDAEISASGVTPTVGSYRPTTVCDEGLAEKLGVPVAYLKRLRETRPDLYDANVNGWLHGYQEVTAGPTVHQTAPPDPRKFLVRCFRGDDGVGVARAFLSDGYKIIDNLDVLTAALEGVREAGVTVTFDGCDLTERRMYVRIVAPEVRALAPILLRGYRSPHSGNSGDANPTVFAGFVLSNSETGGGAFQITPRLVVEVCRNGLTMTRDAMRAVHLGGKMDEGVIRWSETTQRKNLELVTSQARDAVATFLDTEYMTMVLAGLEAQAETELVNPVEAVQLVGQRLRFSEDRVQGILDHFVRGGQVTAGGVLNAVTSYAQTIDDADDAMEVEAQGLRALELAASIRR